MQDGGSCLFSVKIVLPRGDEEEQFEEGEDDIEMGMKKRNEERLRAAHGGKGALLSFCFCEQPLTSSALVQQ